MALFKRPSISLGQKKEKIILADIKIYLTPEALITTNLDLHAIEYHKEILSHNLPASCKELSYLIHFSCNFVLVNDINNCSSKEFTKMRDIQLPHLFHKGRGIFCWFYSINTAHEIKYCVTIIEAIIMMDSAFLGFTNHARILRSRSKILGLQSPESCNIYTKLHRKLKWYYKLE